MSEMAKARELIAAIEARGLTARIEDDELGATEIQNVRVYRDDAYQGSMLLVWGNDPDGSELVADYTDTPLIDGIWREVFWNEEVE